MSKRRDTTISPAVFPDRRFSIGPEDVLRLKKPTNGFLCSLSDEHNIEFLKFTISDEESKRVLFEAGQNVEMVGSMEIDYDAVDESDYARAVKYYFCEDVLRLPLVSTRCVSLRLMSLCCWKATSNGPICILSFLSLASHSRLETHRSRTFE